MVELVCLIKAFVFASSTPFASRSSEFASFKLEIAAFPSVTAFVNVALATLVAALAIFDTKVAISLF